jgi:hypothetical protein
MYCQQPHQPQPAVLAQEVPLVVQPDAQELHGELPSKIPPGRYR